ncbi:MAG TPA: 30S ribosomal protein S13 [Candidatus Thermoplasmatota archaeon]|nr:30S ribosomal protein S13 [Candidatus Thermoplasmatota archaeon]
MADKNEKAEKPEKPEGKPAKPDGKEGKDGKKGKEGGDKKPPVSAKTEKPDFKYIVRIANTDLNGQHRIEVALSHIRGVGPRTAGIVADRVGVARNEKIGNLSDEQVTVLETTVGSLATLLPPWLANRRSDYETGENLHLNGTDLDTRLRDDLNRLKKIRSYKGVRHETGQKVRGQRSRSNGRTGLTMGVQRKAILQAAAGKKEEGAKEEAKPAAAKPAAGAAKPAAAGAAKPAAGGAKPAEKK